MKQLSGIEISFVLKELNLTDAKVEKLYMPEKHELLFTLHKKDAGRINLRVVVPNMLYQTEYRHPTPEKPGGFCVALRKYLTGARIASVEQEGIERIVKIKFKRKEETSYLVLEFFSKGNIILCREDLSIISCTDVVKLSSRVIKPKEIYKSPPTKDLARFAEIIGKSGKESVVKALAIDLGLGGVYAEECCYLAGVDKDEAQPSETEILKLEAAFNTLLAVKPDPCVILDGNNITDIVPINLHAYEDKKSRYFETYNKAIDSAFVVTEETPVATVKESKTDIMIKKQEEKVGAYAKEIDENTAKGELIYTNYAKIEDILNTLGAAKKKYSWKEIKERLKGHAVVKSIDEKKGTATLELT